MGFRLPAAVQRNSMRRVAVEGRDCVIASPTGSGKSLAYLVPLLSLLSDELLGPPPRPRRGARRPAPVRSARWERLSGGGAADADATRYFSQFATPRAGESPEAADTRPTLPTPLAVICVPARELGVQVALLAFQLLGGQRNNPAILPERIPSGFEPGSRTNMFSYKGPRKVKVAGVWDDKGLNASMPVEDFGLDILQGVHIVVGTPQYLGALAERGHLALDNARVVVVDEADACMLSQAEGGAEGAAEGLPPFLRAVSGRVTRDGKPRVRVFAGASLLPGQMQAALAAGWLTEPCVIGQSTDVQVSDAGGFEGLAGQIVPPALTHQFLQCEPTRALGLLARLLRSEVERFRAEGGDEPRIIIYAEDSETAVRIATPLQNSIWTGLGGQVDAGLWGMSVLLPSAEDAQSFVDEDGNVTSSMLAYESSLRVMEMFTFNQINVLVTTPLATRGLDFPSVTHVFNLGLVGSAADYLHRAGRVGRLGQAEAGKIISLLDEAGVQGLQRLGSQLQFTPEAISEADLLDSFLATEASDADSKVRYLEDVFQLYDAEGGEDGALQEPSA
jgi:superfamily II DNA/RNA helicase